MASKQEHGPFFSDVLYRHDLVIRRKAGNFVVFHTNEIVRKAMANPDPSHLSSIIPIQNFFFYMSLKLLYLGCTYLLLLWTVPNGYLDTLHLDSRSAAAINTVLFSSLNVYCNDS